MRVCEFDGTETTLSVCPTCNEYKGLAETKPYTTLGVALDDVFALMEDAQAHHLDTHSNDCDCDYRAGEE